MQGIEISSQQDSRDLLVYISFFFADLFTLDDFSALFVDCC